jgi:hypothetical protein
VSCPDWPLDRFLALLITGGLRPRADERDHRVWWSLCPRCLSGERDLRIVEPCRGGAISLWCKSRSRCSEEEILAAAKERGPLLVAQEREQAALELAEALSALTHRALELAGEVVA